MSTLPCHEYGNNHCFLGGGEILDRPILSPPWQDKASTLCKWLFGCRKTRLVHSFPSLPSESINLTLSWIHIQPLLFRGWGKPWQADPFPSLTSECINLKLSCAEAKLSGWRKTGLVHSFPTPTTESINLTLSWICKQSLLFRGWEKTGPAHSFPTLTSKTVNLTLSWICKQPLLFRVGKNWAGPFFPHPDKIKHQPCAAGYLGAEKLGWSFLFPPWQVKASTLPCHEYIYNPCFLGEGGKLGRPILSPPWLVNVSI